MHRLWCLILGLFLTINAMASEPYTAVINGQYSGTFPSVSLSTAQQDWLQQKSQIILGVSQPDYPPFDIINFNNEYIGITADYAALIANVLHIPVVVKVYNSRQEAILALERKEIDFLGTANGFDAIDKNLILSVPYAEDNPVLAGRQGTLDKNKGSLDGVSVAMVYHYLPPEWVFDAYPGIKLKMYPSNFSAMGSVSFGQNELFLGDNISAEFLSGRRVFDNIEIQRNASLAKTQFSFALNRDDKMFLTLLNSVIDAFNLEQRQQILTYWGAKPRMVQKSTGILLDTDALHWRKAHRILHAALEDNNAPYSFFATGQEPYGINADVLKQVAKISDLQLVWHKVRNAAEARDLMKNGEVDISVTSTFNQQHPPANTSYSSMFYRDSYVITRRLNSNIVSDDLLIKPLRVAVVQGDPILSVIHEQFPRMQPVLSQEATGPFRLLSEGKADIAVAPLTESVFIINNYYKDRLKIDEIFTNHSLHFSFAMADSQPQLLRIINKALASISPAHMNEITNHWRENIFVERDFWTMERKKLLRWFMLLSAVLLLLLFWVYWLRSLNARRIKAEHKLNDQLTFMKDLIDGTPLPIYVRDRKGKLLLCNISYRQHLNIPLDGLLGKTVYEVLDDTGERADELQQSYRRVIECGESIVNDRVLRVGDNDYRIIHHWILPYRNGQGDIIGIIGGWYDISERQQHIERLQLDKEQAVQASEAKSTFLTTMSHEIRTPMNVIIGMLELAGKQADAGIVDKRSLNIAAIEAQGLLELIGDVLDIERAESGHLSLNEQSGNLKQLIHSVCRLFETLVRRKGLKFRLDELGALDRDVLIDPLRFKQIISNLLSNALKFTDKGEIVVSAALEELRDDHLQLTLQISDSGIGISASDSQKLFSRFSQASNNTLSSQQSSGLGLLICKTLSEMMGGTLTLESQLGEGTRTQVVLPLRINHQKRAAPPLPVITGVMSSQRVLIVDDYAANRDVLTLQLNYLGQDVNAANNGREALDLLQQGGFDLVVTDCNMPVMDGYELTRCIRHHEKIHNLPRKRIIGLTANAVNEERQRCLDAGMDDCIFKPVTLAMLASIFEVSTKQQVTQFTVEKQYDLTELMMLTNNDAATLSRLLQTFISGITSDILELDCAAANDERAHLIAIAHRVKGGAELIRAQSVVDACIQLEIHCENGHNYLGCISQLRTELERLSVSLLLHVEGQ